MGDVINLNQYRKQRARDEKAKQAQRRDAEKTATEIEKKKLTPGAKSGPRATPGGEKEPPEDSTPSAR
jgi:ribosomal protein L9